LIPGFATSPTFFLAMNHFPHKHLSQMDTDSFDNANDMHGSSDNEIDQLGSPSQQSFQSIDGIGSQTLGIVDDDPLAFINHHQPNPPNSISWPSFTPPGQRNFPNPIPYNSHTSDQSLSVNPPVPNQHGQDLAEMRGDELPPPKHWSLQTGRGKELPEPGMCIFGLCHPLMIHMCSLQSSPWPK